MCLLAKVIDEQLTTISILWYEGSSIDRKDGNGDLFFHAGSSTRLVCLIELPSPQAFLSSINFMLHFFMQALLIIAVVAFCPLMDSQ